MKRNLFLKMALLAMVIVLVASGDSVSDMRMPSYFNYPRFKVVSDVERGKEAEFELTFMPIKWLEPGEEPAMAGRRLELYPTDTTDMTMGATVTVQGYSDVFSTEILTVGLIGDSTQTFTFSAMIPDLDTVRVGIVLSQAGVTEERRRYFVWNGDEMELRLMNPRFGPDKPDYGRGFPIPDPRVHPDTAYPHGRPFPDDGSVVFSGLTSEQRDSVNTAWMRELERTPLTDSAWERITVGGVKWSRRQGDSLFREPLYYDKLHDSAVRAKMAAFDARTEHEICLDLSDTADYRMVIAMLGAGSPSSKPGFVIFTATRDQINELSSLGFGIMYLEQNPSMRPDVPDSGAVPDAKPSSGKSGLLDDGESEPTRSLLFFEYFDASWTSRWNVSDELPQCGNDMWGPSTIFSNAVWCAKNGDMTESNHYDCSAFAKLTSTMINTEGYYADLSIDFQISYDLETVEGDYLTAKHSYDGNYWWYIDTWNAYNVAFEDITFDVPNNYGTLYLQFVFGSHDNYQGVTRDGAWIKNISVSGTEIAFPNFTWYPIPGTWDDGPLVISQAPGTTTDTDVYGGEPCYLDWAMTNDGDISGSMVQVHLLVDDEVQDSFYVATAEVGNHYGLSDLLTRQHPCDLALS